ncbi:hypothetical protein FHS14_005175 [Paenibacillus baekrokdamisoli]|nr:hypothetical protein [Paenibacillus baekrokdamisoli]
MNNKDLPKNINQNPRNPKKPPLEHSVDKPTIKPPPKK